MLSGASSALYGPGGMNGTMLMTSKNPFKYQGLSFVVKTGMMHTDKRERPTSPYHNWSLRWGKKLSDKFAFKIGGQFIQAQDWQANDKRNLQRNNVLSQLKDGNRQTDPNYDGVNVFGDEASASMQAFAQAVRAQVATAVGTPTYNLFDATLNGLIAGGATPAQIATALGASPFAGLVQYLPFFIPTAAVATNPYKTTYTGATGAGNVSRTGYDERDVVDYNQYNVKLRGG